MIDPGTEISRVADTAFLDDGERVVALNLSLTTMPVPLALQGPASIIWRELSEPMTVRSLVERLSDLFDIAEDDLSENVIAVLELLEDRRLVQESPDG